jgi:hypothetical protein
VRSHSKPSAITYRMSGALAAFICMAFACGHNVVSHVPGTIPPVSESELLDMRDRQDVAAMRDHAWGVYTALTQPSISGDQNSPPVWDTWEDKREVFGGTAAAKVDHTRAREIDLPIEVLASIRASNTNEDDAVSKAVTFIKKRGVAEVLYNPSAAGHIRANKLSDEQALISRWNTLKDLNSPVSESSIAEFPASAIVVKAMWLPVGPKSPQVMTVWDPPNKSKKGCEYGCRSLVKVELAAADQPCNLAVSSAPVLSSCFYNVPDTTREGYRLVLFGLHIATKEMRDWTWSTFWWQIDPDNGPYASKRPDGTVLKGYWRNFVMDTTLSMVTPEEKPRAAEAIPKQRCQITPSTTARVCFNPYLEGGMTNGELSNCINCHRQATYPAMQPSPRGTPQRGYLSSDDPCFGDLQSESGAEEGVMKLDYLWSLSPINPRSNFGEFLRKVEGKLLAADAVSRTSPN